MLKVSSEQLQQWLSQLLKAGMGPNLLMFFVLLVKREDLGNKYAATRKSKQRQPQTDWLHICKINTENLGIYKT